MMKICIVSSSGGHLTEVRCLKPVFEKYDYFYVLNSRVMLPSDMMGRTHFITHSERDFKLFVNFIEAFRILRAERPDVILSTGAGPAVPMALVGRFLGIHVIYIETVTRIHRPSLTGRIMYYLANDFYYQWKPLERYFPKGILGSAMI